MQRLSREWFFGLQDSLLETAKQQMQREGTLTPFVFMLVQPETVSNSIQKNMRTLEGESFETMPKNDEPVLAVLPQHKSASEWFAIAMELLIPAEKRAAIPSMLELGMTTGRTLAQVKAHFLKTVLDARGMDDKDLLAAHIKDVLKRTAALAYIKVDDGYVLHCRPEDRREHPAGLENHEEASEALLIQLETPTFLRLLTLPYARTERNKGAFQSFGAVQERLDERGKGTLEGRLVWLMEAPS